MAHESSVVLRVNSEDGAQYNGRDVQIKAWLIFQNQSIRCEAGLFFVVVVRVVWWFIFFWTTLLVNHYQSSQYVCAGASLCLCLCLSDRPDITVPVDWA